MCSRLLPNASAKIFCIIFVFPSLCRKSRGSHESKKSVFLISSINYELYSIVQLSCRLENICCLHLRFVVFMMIFPAQSESALNKKCAHTFRLFRRSQLSNMSFSFSFSRTYARPAAWKCKSDIRCY